MRLHAFNRDMTMSPATASRCVSDRSSASNCSDCGASNHSRLTMATRRGPGDVKSAICTSVYRKEAYRVVRQAQIILTCEHRLGGRARERGSQAIATTEGTPNRSFVPRCEVNFS